MSGKADPAQSERAPVAMIRGNRPHWRLQDAPGPEWPGQFIEPPALATMVGSFEDAQDYFSAWCNEHGYYLSSWSDGDDRG